MATFAMRAILCFGLAASLGIVVCGLTAKFYLTAEQIIVFSAMGAFWDACFVLFNRWSAIKRCTSKDRRRAELLSVGMGVMYRIMIAAGIMSALLLVREYFSAWAILLSSLALGIIFAFVAIKNKLREVGQWPWSIDQRKG